MPVDNRGGDESRRKDGGHLRVYCSFYVYTFT